MRQTQIEKSKGYLCPNSFLGEAFSNFNLNFKEISDAYN